MNMVIRAGSPGRWGRKGGRVRGLEMSHQPHTRRAFDTRLTELSERTNMLASSVDRQYRLVAQALADGSNEPLETVLKEDASVDDAEMLLDELVVRLLSTLSPKASDLRRTVAAAKVARELERAGDEACNASKQLLKLGGRRSARIDASMAKIAAMVADQIHSASLSLLRLDAESAARCIELDREINDGVRALRDEALSTLTDVDTVMAYVALGRSMERGGDHAKVVAKLTIWTSTGKNLRHGRSRGA